MKRTEVLASAPGPFADFLQANPNETRWDALRDGDRPAYLSLRRALLLRQRGLCAFCEIPLREGDQQIEHWVPKSMSTVAMNWTFDIGNLHLSCENLSKLKWFAADRLRGTDPAPGPNEHCGPAKKNDPPSAPLHGATPVRPTELPVTPPIFKVHSNGAIYPSVVGCHAAGIGSDRAAAAVAFLNLDCTRLRNMREAVFEDLDAAFIELVEDGRTDGEALEELCELTIVLDTNGNLPAFPTTLRSYFGTLAEARLSGIPDWASHP